MAQYLTLCMYLQKALNYVIGQSPEAVPFKNLGYVLSVGKFYFKVITMC